MTRPTDDEEQPAGKVSATTDRLERLANMASAAAQAKQWRARQNGMTEQAEPAEVRDLTHDAEAKTRAEAAMQAMMAKGAGEPRGW